MSEIVVGELKLDKGRFNPKVTIINIKLRIKLKLSIVIEFYIEVFNNKFIGVFITLVNSYNIKINELKNRFDKK